MVDSTLRFLIERVGQVDGAYPNEGQVAEDFLLRRTAGNGIEMLGILAFRASPVWVMAALADLSGAGRRLIPEIASALEAEGLLDPNARFETVEQMLDGFERTAGRLAESINTPPLDVVSLRREWAELKLEAARIGSLGLPSPEVLRAGWDELRNEAAAQGSSVFALSSVMAVSAVSGLPERVRWLSRCAQTAARRSGEVFAGTLLNHYRETLEDIRTTGFLAYWRRIFRPYLRAAASHFLPGRESLTEKWLRKRPSDPA
jgi:hypothetical protein